MEEAIIKSVLSKCRSRDIEALIRKWGWFSDEDLQLVDFRATKRIIASNIVQLCQKLGLKQEIGDLDLLCTQMHSSLRKWIVLKLKGSLINTDIEPQELQERLAAVLEPECLGRVHLNVRSFGGATWVRVYLQESAPFRTTDVVYVLSYPHTPIIITCRMKVKMQEILYSALEEVFETEGICELQLTGRHLPSLADLALQQSSQMEEIGELQLTRYLVPSLGDLALQQSSQGPFRKYRDLEEAENPLVRNKPAKTKEPSGDEVKITNPRLRDENRHEKQRRQDKLDRTFGTHAQPHLETLEYKLDLRFRGTTFAPAMKDRPDLFRCRVKFEGTSVLEGTKNLGRTGLATLPLLKHLASVHSLARNHFTIAEMDSVQKRSASQSNQR